MLYYKIIRLLISIISIITLVLTPITTSLLGIIGSIPIVGSILILTISLVWSVIFLFPLIGLSWIATKIKFLSPLIALIGIPLSVCAFIFANLMPSFGDWDGRFSKILLSS